MTPSPYSDSEHKSFQQGKEQLFMFLASLIAFGTLNFIVMLAIPKITTENPGFYATTPVTFLFVLLLTAITHRPDSQ